MSSSKRSRAAFETDNNAPPQHAPFALYGTPLPTYDSDVKDDGSYVPVWKQEVTDERGRKRLHGAFTGGFSAGYFNTVGSKEGWTPQTFVSSRSLRAKREEGKEAQRVEDFMDEEDLAEREESVKLETQGGFAGLGGIVGGGDGWGKGMFGDLFRAEGETMGVKLLQKMGWRRGQGVGPKVRRRAEGDRTGETHLFAPDNSEMISFDRKNDRKGLGFAGENKLSNTNDEKTNGQDEEDDSDQDARILQSNRSKMSSKPKKLKKSGFGVGVLNDNGSDDEDPYAMGPQISYNRIIGGDKKKKKGGLTASNANPNVQKPIFTSKKLNQSTSALPNPRAFRKCHDGRLPLEGFILATASLTLQDNENKYPPPPVPENWTPSRLARSQTPADNHSSFTSTADAAKAPTLNPATRASLLGEQPLPGKSVFDFLSPAARNKLATASNNPSLPQGKGEGAPAGYTPSAADRSRNLWDLVPDLDRATAEAALARGKGGWMPYAEDEGKRARYQGFLELKSGVRSNLPERVQGMETEVWARELVEFRRAAEVFKPVSGLMASRFRSSSSSAPRLASDAPDTRGSGEKKGEDPAEKAAKMGMFGPLTRSRLQFFPTRLLCKRFNVRAPANVGGDAGAAAHDPAGGGGSGMGKNLELVSQASLNRMMNDASWSQPGGKGGCGFVSGGTEGGSGEEEREKVRERERDRDSRVVDAERNAALEGQKAGEAVFRSIFGDDGESDEE